MVINQEGKKISSHEFRKTTLALGHLSYNVNIKVYYITFYNIPLKI